MHHAIYHFNGPQLSQETHFNLVKTLVYSLFYVSNPDSKLVTHQWHIFFHSSFASSEGWVEYKIYN